MATLSLLIPIAVARAVVESKWYKDRDIKPTDATAFGRFQQAARSTYRTKLYVSSVDEVRAASEAVEAARLEQTQKTVIEKIVRFQAHLEELSERLDRSAENEEKQKAERTAQMRAINRSDSRKQRERPMSMYVEAGQSVLADVAEDYGLSIKDHQIRAALVAAYRAGAQAMQQSTNYLMVQRDSSFDYPAEDIARWHERNRLIFDRVAPQEQS